MDYKRIIDENTGLEIAEGRNVDDLEIDVDPGKNKRNITKTRMKSDDSFEPVTYKVFSTS